MKTINKIHKNEIKILEILSENKNLSQRKISNSLGISLGMVNIFLKKLVGKGLLKIKKTTNKRSLQYILTKKGFSERLNFNIYYLKKNLEYYSSAKKILIDKLEDLYNKDISNIYIWGIDDWSELIYLAMQNFDFNFLGFILENKDAIKEKFNNKVYNLDNILENSFNTLNIISNLEFKNNIDKKYINNDKVNWVFF